MVAAKKKVLQMNHRTCVCTIAISELTKREKMGTIIICSSLEKMVI